MTSKLSSKVPPTDLARLARLCFSAETYDRNFPQIFLYPTGVLWGLYQQDQLVAGCSVYPSYFCHKTGLVVGMGIGSVCTHPDYRKQGLAAYLLQKVQIALQTQADFLYLFSEPRSLYERLGYRLCGSAPLMHLPIRSPILVIKDAPNRSHQGDGAWTETPHTLCQAEKTQLWAFIARHSRPQESLLSYLEFQHTLHTKNMNLARLFREDVLVGTCFFGKGDDFPNVIHGLYASDQETGLALLQFVQQKQGRPDLLFFPGAHQDEWDAVCTTTPLPAMYAQFLNPQLQPEDVFIRSLQGT